MSQYTVLFDANVLYPAPMRDALMQLAVTDLFKAKWTADAQSTNVRMDEYEPPVSSLRLLLRFKNVSPSEDGSRQ